MNHKMTSSKTLLVLFDNHIAIEIRQEKVHINSNCTGIAVSKSEFAHVLEWMIEIQNMCIQFPDCIQYILNKIADIKFTDWNISFYSIMISNKDRFLLFNLTSNSESVKMMFSLQCDINALLIKL